MSSAKITLWDTLIGYIAWDQKQNTAVFESSEAYLDAPFNIAPIIHPNKREFLIGHDFHDKFQGMVPTFYDTLPDAFGNVIFKEWLEQMNMDQSAMNPVERLLYIGKRGMGALEYHYEKRVPSNKQKLDLEELAQLSHKIIQRKYAQKDYLHNPEALQNILRIGASVGGAQAKVLVAISRETKQPNQRLLAGDIIHTIPVDYYIVKLAHDPKDLWNKEKHYVEYVYNAMAKDAGVAVADSRLIFEGGRAHFASKRFDRIEHQKLHKQTVSALAGFFGRNTEFGYESIFKIMEFLNLPYKDKMQLYTQMVFNVLASNRDDHTRNFSFLMDKQGKWSLSPAYDLTFPFDPYQSFFMPHKISINNKVKEINRNDLKAIADKVGIVYYKEIIERVIEQVLSFPDRIKNYDVQKRTVDLIMRDIQKNLNHLFAS